jgi:hypothetical protein
MHKRCRGSCGKAAQLPVCKVSWYGLMLLSVYASSKLVCVFRCALVGFLIGMAVATVLYVVVRQRLRGMTREGSSNGGSAVLAIWFFCRCFLSEA